MCAYTLVISVKSTPCCLSPWPLLHCHLSVLTHSLYSGPHTCRYTLHPHPIPNRSCYSGLHAGVAGPHSSSAPSPSLQPSTPFRHGHTVDVLASTTRLVTAGHCPTFACSTLLPVISPGVSTCSVSSTVARARLLCRSSQTPIPHLGQQSLTWKDATVL